MSNYAITGIQKGRGPNGSVPLRREVDEWWFSQEKNDLYQRSLFIYALHHFQNIDPNDRDSYFQIAGIHGQPLQSWDSKEPESDWYCVHANVLFPPWHRPYMLLYEQRLYEIMLQLIPTTFAAQDHADLIHAAETWRLPFWDFAEKKPDWKTPNDTSKFGPNAPYIITVPKVEVLTKTGVALVDNPMWKFTIPKTDPNKTTFGDWGVKEVKTDDGTLVPFHTSKSTVRYPETKDPKHPLYESAWVNGDKQDHEAITKSLRSAEAVDHNTLPEAVYRLFLEQYTPDWNAFASLGYTPNQAVTKFASLEDVHGAVHDFTGGTGHMSQVGVAGFDPLFWMHHNNIDRIFALYQAVYPNKYVEPYEDKVRGKVDINTPLLPFKKDTKGTVWTAAGVRDPKQLGYTYPELQEWLPCYQTNGQFDAAKFQRALRTTLELKYSTTGKVVATLPGNEELAKQLMNAVPVGNLKFENFPPALVALHNTIKDAGTAVSTVGAVGVGLLAGFAGALSTPPPMSVPVTSWEEQDYVLNVLYDRFALGGNPYTIRIFLGDVPFDPPAGATGAALTPFVPIADLSFHNNPNQVGLVYNFSSPAEFRGTTSNGCEACKRAKEFGDLSTGQVILTDHLIGRIRDENISLSSLTKEDVSTWLKNELHWRIIDQNGKLVPRETFPSLKVSVAMGKGIHYLDACKPSVYTGYETLWSITDGRPCGSSPGDHV